MGRPLRLLGPGASLEPLAGQFLQQDHRQPHRQESRAGEGLFPPPHRLPLRAPLPLMAEGKADASFPFSSSPSTLPLHSWHSLWPEPLLVPRCPLQAGLERESALGAQGLGQGFRKDSASFCSVDAFPKRPCQSVALRGCFKKEQPRSRTGSDPKELGSGVQKVLPLQLSLSLPIPGNSLKLPELRRQAGPFGLGAQPPPLFSSQPLRAG